MRFNLIALSASVFVTLAFSAAPAHAQRVPRQVVHQQVANPWSGIASFDAAAVRRYINAQLAYEVEAGRSATGSAASRADRGARAATRQYLNALRTEARRAQQDLNRIQRDYRRNYQGPRRSLIGSLVHSECRLTSWAVISEILLYERQRRRC